MKVKKCFENYLTLGDLKEVKQSSFFSKNLRQVLLLICDVIIFDVIIVCLIWLIKKLYWKKIE